MPISSKIDKIYEDETLIDNSDFDEGNIPKTSKLMIRKTFVVSKESVLKKYDKMQYNLIFDNFRV